MFTDTVVFSFFCADLAISGHIFGAPDNRGAND